MGKTIYDKIWDSHRVVDDSRNTALLYVDRHYIYEVSSPQAFDRLRRNGVTVRRPEATIATMDHNVPTVRQPPRGIDPLSRRQMDALAANCREFGIRLYDVDHPRNGVIHVVFPELGYTQPGMVVACGDSHTLTHGALGALPVPTTSDVEHILATQTVRMEKSPTLCITIRGRVRWPVTAKDIVLFVIGKMGVNGCRAHVVEFRGEAVDDLSVEGRMTLCNMATEMGARAAIISPDEKVLAYMKDKPYAPSAARWDDAEACWKSMASDPDCRYDRTVALDVDGLSPQVSWGTKPSQVAGIDERLPEKAPDGNTGASGEFERALAYMGLTPGMPMTDIAVQHVFVGSCTNGRLEDLRSAARVLEGRRVHAGVRAIAVPGSRSVKRAAEDEGIADIFRAAGFDWRKPGCSMCLAMNGDRIPRGENCASTSNRNFENRQGKGARTFLSSPAMAAAAAIAGRFVDVRNL